MKRTIYIAAGIIALTAAIGTALWATGYPPPRDGLSDGKTLTRTIISFPLFWAGISTLITVPIVLFKAEGFRTATGKTRALPQIGVLMPSIAVLLMQIIVPLDVYDLISEKAGDLGFFGLITVFFLLIGNYIATVPFESRYGFRSKATLSDSVVWAKTHRLLGRNIVLTSLLMIPVAFVIDTQIAQWTQIGLVMLMKALAFIYARQLAARTRLRNPAI